MDEVLELVCERRSHFTVPCIGVEKYDIQVICCAALKISCYREIRSAIVGRFGDIKEQDKNPGITISVGLVAECPGNRGVYDAIEGLCKILDLALYNIQALLDKHVAVLSGCLACGVDDIVFHGCEISAYKRLYIPRYDAGVCKVFSPADIVCYTPGQVFPGLMDSMEGRGVINPHRVSRIDTPGVWRWFISRYGSACG